MHFPRFARIPRLSRFNADTWWHWKMLGSAKCRRIVIASALTVVALAGTIAVWPSRPAAAHASERAVAWKTSAPPRKATGTARTRTVRKPAGAPPAVAVRTVRTTGGKTAVARTPAARPAARTAARIPRTGDPLGPAYVDEVNGFSMRFPARWSLRAVGGGEWLLDCGDTRQGLISIGFTRPGSAAVRQVSQRDPVTLLARGSAVIGGRKAIWRKSTGPLPLGAAKPRMTRIDYQLPLSAGRTLDIRIAATPEAFEQVAKLMKQSVGSFRLLTTPAQRPVRNSESVASSD